MLPKPRSASSRPPKHSTSRDSTSIGTTSRPCSRSMPANGERRSARSRSTTRCSGTACPASCASSSRTWSGASGNDQAQPRPSRLRAFGIPGSSSAPLMGALVSAVALGAYVVAALHDPRHLWSMIDLQVYRWGGEMARQHRNVYDLKFGGFLSFTYTPLAVLAFELMSHLSLGVLRFVITGASLAALVGALWVAFGMAGGAGAGQRGIPAGLTFATPRGGPGLGPLTQTLRLGQ